jgi:hypothetical protein
MVSSFALIQQARIFADSGFFLLEPSRMDSTVRRAIDIVSLTDWAVGLIAGKGDTG